MGTERRPHPSRSTARARTPQATPAQNRPTPGAGAVPRDRLLRSGARPPARPQARRPGGPQAGARARTGSRRRATTGPKKTLRVPLASTAGRLRIVLVAMAIALSLCAGRLLQLQGFDSAAYAADSAEQLTRTLPLLPSRGDITDRNGLVMASTEAAVSVTADPQLTRPNAAEIAAVLSGYLKMDQTSLYTLLTRPNTRFVYLAKKVPALTYSRIAADLTTKKLYGVFRESDPIRTYPGGQVGAAVVGFVNSDGQGMAGLEQSMNKELAGVEGKEVYESAPNGSKIPLGTSHITPATNGINYQLTIDSELQWMAERRMAQQVKANDADSGFAITMNVKTGEILAMANAPTYDSSNPGAAAKVNGLSNPAVSNVYEPGSVEKVLTSAALIDSGTTTPETRVVIPNRVMSGGRLIKDHINHPTLHYLMRGVIAESSNIGTLLMTRQMRVQQLHDYLTSFGLGAPTSVELPDQAAGTLPPSTMPGYTRDQIAFGQGLSVTGVQEAAAIAGIINGGVYHAPTILEGGTDSTGAAVPIARQPPRQVVSAATSASVRNLMRAVVDNNPAALALDDYPTGGKTGTAQRVVTSCHCYRGYVTSYVGFAPLNDPKILTYVVIDNPRNRSTGSGTAALAYKDIMNFALPRYSVPPGNSHFTPQPIEW